MARVVIFGSGAGADAAFRYLSRDSPHEIVAFAVDSRFLARREFHGLPVVAFESIESQYPPDAYELFAPMGFQRMNGVRADKYFEGKRRGYRFISYINSRHYALEPPPVGENCFILDSQIFNLDVSIGDNVTMWSGNHIGDRTRIGSHVWISSHVTLAGDVSVGDYCFLGVNACVSNRVTLAPRTFVGANALIAKDTAPDSVYLSAPAKPLPVTSERFLSMQEPGGAV